jgi:protein-L-isoaspartate(D-aspartate) O-methyltransferase
MDFRAARTNMVESQVRTNDVTDLDVQHAMRKVERERLLPPDRAFAAYAEVETEIANGRRLMIPRDISKLLQLARPRAGETALAMAAPYAAMVMGQIGLDVTAQEADEAVAGIVREPLAEYGAKLVVADFAKPARMSVDLIVCEAAVTQLPQAWLDALKPGGRLAGVVRDGPVGRARLWVKTGPAASAGTGFDATPPYLPGFGPQPAFQF